MNVTHCSAAKLFLLILVLTIVFSGCSGGGEKKEEPPINPPENPLAGILKGVAAAGAPIVGVVNVKGAQGNTASSPIAIDGTYSMDVSGLTAPYILYAQGSVGNRSVSLYSIAMTDGEINITPVTDFIVQNAMGVSVQSAYTNWSVTQTTQSQLDAAETDVQNQLSPLLNAMNVSTEINLLSTLFTADGSGFDAVLDALSITYSGVTATVTNTLTGSSYTDNITTLGDSAGLPASDQALVQSILVDQPAITAFWQTLTDLYATQPSDTAINEWFNNYVANDFLAWGTDKNSMNGNWLTGDGPVVSLAFSAKIAAPLDKEMLGGYVKGYSITLSYAGDQWIDTMVFDGSGWLWFGNRDWVDISFGSKAYLDISSGGDKSMATGIDIDVEDNTNYAYDRGVRSMVVNGPGLPENLLFLHNYPDPEFQMFQSNNNISRLFYQVNDDATIEAIPDNAQYRFTLCVETAVEIDSGANCTAVASFVRTNTKAPVKNMELNENLFINLTAPTSHASALINFGGEILVSWTRPANIVGEVNVEMYWQAGNVEYNVEAEGDESVILNTTGMPAPDNFSVIVVAANDSFGRQFRVNWGIYPGF